MNKGYEKYNRELKLLSFNAEFYIAHVNALFTFPAKTVQKIFLFPLGSSLFLLRK